MEFAVLANIISNLDIENFVSSVQTFSEIFSAKWSCLWRKMQICNTSGPTSNKENLGGEERMQFGIEEINLVMSGLGMVGGLEENGKKSFLGEDDILALFEEVEPSLEEIKETFGVFDANKDGFIDGSELQRVLWNLGLEEGCTLEECNRMIKAFDGNGDGLIDCEEFVKFMEKCLC